MLRTGNSRSDRNNLYRRWSAEQLDLRSDAPSAEVRRKLLEKVSEEDLVPSEEDRTALRVMSGSIDVSQVPYGSPDWAAEQKLSEEVEAFATEFFQQPAQERIDLWMGFFSRAGNFLTVQARLRELEPGLRINVKVPRTFSEDARELATGILDRFVLPAWERARARRQEQAERADGQKRWRSAARELQQNLPVIAQLDGAFLKELLESPKRRTTTHATRPIKAAATTSSKIGAWPWVLVGVMILVRVVAGLTTDSRPRTPPIPRFQAPGPLEQRFGPELQKIFSKGSGNQNPLPQADTKSDIEKLLNGNSLAKGHIDPKSIKIGKEINLNDPEEFNRAFGDVDLLNPDHDALQKMITGRHDRPADVPEKSDLSPDEQNQYQIAARLHGILAEQDPGSVAKQRHAAKAWDKAIRVLPPGDGRLADAYLAAIDLARIVVNRNDATAADRQFYFELLDRFAEFRQSRNDSARALELLREGESISKRIWQKHPDDPALRDQYEARVAAVFGQLVEMKMDDEAVEAGRQRRDLQIKDPERLKVLALEFVRIAAMRRTTGKDLAARFKLGSEWLALTRSTLESAVSAGLRDLKTLDTDEEWSLLRESAGYAEWRGKLQPKASEPGK